MTHIGPDLAVGAVDPLLDLRQELIHQPLPALRLGQVAKLAPFTPGHPVGHGVRRTPRQLARGPERAAQIERFENLSHLLAILHIVLLVEGHRFGHRQLDREGTHHGWTPGQMSNTAARFSLATSAQFQWPSPRSFVSAYAQNLMSADRIDELAASVAHQGAGVSELVGVALEQVPGGLGGPRSGGVEGDPMCGPVVMRLGFG